MKCPYCNREVSGRTDKVFCDDKCRNNYYYKINGERSTYIRNINKKLLRNRGILKTLNPAGKKYVVKKTLDDLGFDFTCFTGVYKTKKGKSIASFTTRRSALKTIIGCAYLFFIVMLSPS